MSRQQKNHVSKHSNEQKDILGSLLVWFWNKIFVIKVHFELAILFPPPKCWDYRDATLYLAINKFRIRKTSPKNIILFPSQIGRINSILNWNSNGMTSFFKHWVKRPLLSWKGKYLKSRHMNTCLRHHYMYFISSYHKTQEMAPFLHLWIPLSPQPFWSPGSVQTKEGKLHYQFLFFQ